MPVRVDGQCETTAWSEETYFTDDREVKLARASVTTIFSGGVMGEASAQYLKVYVSDERGTFVGLERVAGAVGERAGSFVVQTEGTFEPGVIRAEWAVVPGSGRGGLISLSGSGTYFGESKQGHRTLFTFEYEMEA
jgi:Protein of unknown function (DUF3224)